GVGGVGSGALALDEPEARVAWLRQTPLVVTPETAEVTIEAAIQGTFEEAKLQLATSQQAPLSLNDAGRDGDQVAGDRIYSLRLAAARIRGAARPGGVFRADVGAIRLYRDGRLISGSQYRVASNVWTAEIPRVEIQQLASGVQKSAHLVNFADSTYLARMIAAPMGSTEERRLHGEVCQRCYRHFGDDFDFINIIYAAGIG